MQGPQARPGLSHLVMGMLMGLEGNDSGEREKVEVGRSQTTEDLLATRRILVFMQRHWGALGGFVSRGGLWADLGWSSHMSASLGSWLPEPQNVLGWWQWSLALWSIGQALP